MESPPVVEDVKITGVQDHFFPVLHVRVVSGQGDRIHPNPVTYTSSQHISGLSMR